MSFFGAGLAAALAGCGSVGTAATNRMNQTPRTTTASAKIDGSVASCAGLSPKQQLAIARLVFVGRARPGPTAHLDGRNVLISPARFRVERYIKGDGPTKLRVFTAVRASGAVAEDGIEPQAGESWQIYITSKHGPYDTNICLGSRQVRSHQS
ncbi:MAG TPA: hypothetical protein VGF91_31025 [Solirubrobacteraceae bacterium]|jgi:hypothetical protein